MLRTRNTFDPDSKEPYKLSCSSLELFLQCPRCFYLDRRLGVERVKDPSFVVINAINSLHEKEPYWFRDKESQPSLMKQCGIDGVSFIDENIKNQGKDFSVIQFHHSDTNFIIGTDIDDIWQTPDDQLHIVNFVRSYTTKEVMLDDRWKQGCKWLMEMQQWILRRNGLKISNVGYFLFIDANIEKQFSNSELKFSLQSVEYSGDDKWVDEAIQYAHDCLKDDEIPDIQEECSWCSYSQAVSAVFRLEEKRKNRN